MTSAIDRTAIRCLRPEFSRDPFAEITMMTDFAIAHDLTPGPVIFIDPRREAPCTTVLTAIAEYGATAVIVPDLEHVDGIDHQIRERARLVTVDQGVILEQLPPKVVAA